MEQITFICCYNKREQLEDMLLNSLNRLHPNQASPLQFTLNGQTKSYKLNILLIEGTKYRSAAEAYNDTIRQFKESIGDFIVFTHQDIAFDNFDFLRSIIEHLSENPYQVIGIAGMPEGGKTISNARYLHTNERIVGTCTHTPVEVCSLDECLFATTRRLYDQIHFDEQVCDHWHLYAVDFCLEAKRKLGAKIIVIPDLVYHKYNDEEGLSTDKHFLKSLYAMVGKYQNDYSTIYTPCYHISTCRVKALWKIARTWLKNMLSII